MRLASGSPLSGASARLSAKASRPGAGKSKEQRKEGARAEARAGRGAGGKGAGRLHRQDTIHSAGHLSSGAVLRHCPRPRHGLCGARNLNGDGSLVMSVITSIRQGAFAASASPSALRNPAASVTRQDGTPKARA